VDAATQELRAAAANLSAPELTLRECAELGTSITAILANLVAVTEPLAEGLATLSTRTRLRHLYGEDATEHLASAAKHLGDLRARLSGAVAASGSYRHEIHTLEEAPAEE